MTYIHPYWRNDPGAPFATLLQLVDTYCHPEAAPGSYEELRQLARDPHDEEMRVFKEQLRQALFDPGEIPEGALWTAAEFGDGSDEAFLMRLWRDLYADEPVRAEPA